MRLVLALVLGLGLFSAPSLADTNTLSTVPLNRQDMLMSFAPLVKRVAPAVVNVYAKTIVRQQQQAGPFDDPFFKHFFPQLQTGQPKERVANSLGSGVIVDKTGVIVTNNHVIAGASDIRVVLADKREFEAKVVLADEKTDLAILRISVGDENLPTLPLANSDQLEVGDLVLAIGNPFGVGQTVTSGIVSALSRNDVSGNDYQSFIQTDAAINPGNSGGALVNMKGELVGINSMIYTRTGGSVGLGFAIPTNLVETVLQPAVSGQKLVRPWFGGDFQNVTPDIADALGMERPEGVLVLNINKLSPLAKAGLESGDVILAMDGKSLENPQELHYLLGLSHVGDQKLLEVRRNGETHNFTIVLIAAPESVPRDEQTLAAPTVLAGVKVENLSPATAVELGVDQTLSGVVVSDVSGVKGQQFLAKGDIIRGLNGVTIDSVQTLLNTVQQAGRGLTIAIERGAQKLFIRLG